MAQKIIASDYMEFSDKDTGNYVSWLTNDVEQISENVFSNLFVIIDSVAQTVFSLFALFYLGAGIGITAIILFALMAVVPQLASKGLEDKNMMMSKANEEATEKYKENISGFTLFYLANRRNYFVDKIKEISRTQENAVYAKEKKLAFVQIVGAAMGLMCQVALIIVTIFMASLGITMIGAVLSVGNLSQTFFSNVGSAVESVIKAKSAEKLLEKYAIDENRSLKSKTVESVSKILVDHLGYAFDEKVIFQGLSCVFEKGKKYALIGESGSGKTTFAKVIAGLLEYHEGSVTYDTLELNEIQRNSLFNQVAYVDQNVFVFADSIRFNITLGEDFTDDEIWAALKKSQLNEFVDCLDGKLEYQLTENGKNLSGGQRQRLALARAFIRKVSFIIIDEGTAALDKKNATEIEKTLMKESDIGVIIISHNLCEETMEQMDGVISLPEVLSTEIE